jgi:aminoglycoside phosphotransferase (APT) family kinase protein
MATSPTQRVIGPADMAQLTREAFGAGVDVVATRPLSGGGFAAVFRLELSDSRTVVLKVGPPPAARLLRYEQGIIGAEAHYLRRVAQAALSIPQPRLLHYGNDTPTSEGEWLFTEFLSGVALTELGDGPRVDEKVRADLGAVIARLHTITGEHFGYDGARAQAGTWPEAFAQIVDWLLADAAEWAVDLCVPADRIRRLIDRSAGLLGQVERPALVHFDLWDGNVLCTKQPDGRWGLNGLVDAERCLFGDPLIDFVSTALFRDIEQEPDHPFLRGYAAQLGRPVEFAGPQLRRLTLYKIWLYLLMIVEMPSRGMTRQNETRRAELLDELLLRYMAETDSWD